MKRLLFVFALLLLTSTAFSQVIFDLGLTAGLNFSKLNIDGLETSVDEESITKTHWGVFGRIGIGKTFIQPEAYFTKKGGDISNDVFDMTAGFDYSAFDMPLLLGYELFDWKVLDCKIFAGPVFSFVTDTDFSGDGDWYNEDYINDKLFGYQVGIGFDVLFMTFDMRYEHSGDIYEQPGTVTGNTNTYMLCVGFKIL